MRSDDKSCDELDGRRVKVSWPKHKEFTKGVVLHSHSGKNLVVCTDGLEEILNRKRANGEPVNEAFSNQATEKCNPTHASSDTHPVPVASKAYGDELVGCKIKIWRLKTSTVSEGVVASYNRSTKKHLVVYTDGVEEMLNLTKHIEVAEDVSGDQAQKTQSPAPEVSSVYTDEMDADLHARKKQKGSCPDRTTYCASPELTDLKVPKVEADISPTDFKSSSIIGDDDLIDVGGYKVKTSASSILVAIFDKHGDIAARCRFRSKSIRASLLEVVCNVVKRLRHHDLEAVLSDLEDISNEVLDLEDSKIEVSWLNNYVAQLRRIVPLKEKSMELSKLKANIGVLYKSASDELVERHAELVVAEERFKEASKRVEAVNLVAGKIDVDMMESELEEYFWRRRLDELP